MIGEWCFAGLRESCGAAPMGRSDTLSATGQRISGAEVPRSGGVFFFFLNFKVFEFVFVFLAFVFSLFFMFVVLFLHGV